MGSLTRVTSTRETGLLCLRSIGSSPHGRQRGAGSCIMNDGKVSLYRHDSNDHSPIFIQNYASRNEMSSTEPLNDDMTVSVGTQTPAPQEKGTDKNELFRSNLGGALRQTGVFQNKDVIRMAKQTLHNDCHAVTVSTS